MNTSHILLGLVRRYRAPVVVTDRALFLDTLTRLHSVIVASENLLQVAADHATDPELSLYYAQHLDEERYHAEWLAEDLASAGVEIGPVSARVMEIVGSIYYMIFHVNPAALLGYMLVLESSPLTTAQVDELETTHGPALVRTLRHHVENDPDHLIKLCEMIDKSDHADIICSAASKAILLLRI